MAALVHPYPRGTRVYLRPRGPEGATLTGRLGVVTRFDTETYDVALRGWGTVTVPHAKVGAVSS